MIIFLFGKEKVWLWQAFIHSWNFMYSKHKRKIKGSVSPLTVENRLNIWRNSVNINYIKYNKYIKWNIMKYIYNEIYLRHKKRRKSCRQENTGESGEPYATWSKPDREIQVLYYTIHWWNLTKKKLIPYKERVQMWLPGPGGGGVGELCIE